VPTAVDDSPSPAPSLTNPFGLGFRTPDSPPSNLLPSPAPSPEESPTLDEPGPASGDEWDDAGQPPSPEDTSSAASSRGSDAPELIDDEALRDMARAGVAMAGHQAHTHLARTDGQKAVGLYLTDTDDQQRIGDPLARIAARHQGIGEISPDTKDLLASLVGIANYATKTITLNAEAKRRDVAGAQQPQEVPAP
jgi:hypothetical protein